MEARTPESRCAACGAPFRCGAEAGDARCWCFELPRVTEISAAACLCPKCLEEKLKAQAAG